MRRSVRDTGVLTYQENRTFPDDRAESSGWFSQCSFGWSEGGLPAIILHHDTIASILYFLPSAL